MYVIGFMFVATALFVVLMAYLDISGRLGPPSWKIDVCEDLGLTPEDPRYKKLMGEDNRD